MLILSPSGRSIPWPCSLGREDTGWTGGIHRAFEWTSVPSLPHRFAVFRVGEKGSVLMLSCAETWAIFIQEPVTFKSFLQGRCPSSWGARDSRASKTQAVPTGQLHRPCSHRRGQLGGVCNVGNYHENKQVLFPSSSQRNGPGKRETRELLGILKPRVSQLQRALTYLRLLGRNFV